MWGMGSQDLQGEWLWQGHWSLRLWGGLRALLESVFICCPEVSCLEMMKSTGLGTTSWLCDLRA